jgi:hypothetical protein
MKSIRSTSGRLIEPALAFGVPLASRRPQGRLCRGWLAGTPLSDSSIASRALAAFALRGGQVPDLRIAREGKTKKAIASDRKEDEERRY